MPAAGFVFDLLHRTGEVEVDDVVTRLRKQARRFRHRVGLGADDLPGDGMVFVVDVDRLAQPMPAVDQDRVEQRLGDGVGTCPPPRDDAHGAVAVPRQTGLAERRRKLDRTDFHRIKCGTRIDTNLHEFTRINCF